VGCNIRTTHVNGVSHVNIPQAHLPPAAAQAGDNSTNADHSVVAIHAKGFGDDVSSLSATENDNARSPIFHEFGANRDSQKHHI